jgi:hypothetical protein
MGCIDGRGKWIEKYIVLIEIEIRQFVKRVE